VVIPHLEKSFQINDNLAFKATTVKGDEPLGQIEGNSNCKTGSGIKNFDFLSLDHYEFDIGQPVTS